MFSSQVLDHFQNPRNAGTLDDATATVRQENPACGDILELAVKVEHDRVLDIRFRAKGCVPSMACASLLTEMVKGRSLAEAQNLRREELVGAIGGLPPESVHASHLVMDALGAMLKKVNSKP